MIADKRNVHITNSYYNKVIKYNQLLYPGTSGDYVQIGDGPRLAPGDKGYVEAFTPVKPDSSKLISSANNSRDVNLKSNEGQVVTVPIDTKGSNLNNQMIAGKSGSKEIVFVEVSSSKNSLNSLKRLERHYT